MSDFREIEVEVGVWPNERSYRVTTENGVPFRVESISYGSFGRLSYREVKRDGAAWNRALKAAGLGSRCAESAS